MLKCHIMIGIPCSGKTTLAGQMRRVNPKLKIVSSDAVRTELKLSYDKTSNLTVFAEVNRRLESLLRKGHDVVLDATNLDDDYREEPMRIGRSCGAQIIAKVISTDYQVCEKRNSERIEAKRVPDNAMQAMFRQFKKTVQNLKGFDDVEVHSTASAYHQRLARKSRVENGRTWGSR